MLSETTPPEWFNPDLENQKKAGTLNSRSNSSALIFFPSVFGNLRECWHFIYTKPLFSLQNLVARRDD